MPKGKIQQIIQEKIELKIKLENDWQDFLKKDTYLIFDEKQQFLDTVKQSKIIPRSSFSMSKNLTI